MLLIYFSQLVFVLFWEKVLNEDIDPAFGMIYSSLNVLTPVVLTIACYLSMIFVVRVFETMSEVQLFIVLKIS